MLRLSAAVAALVLVCAPLPAQAANQALSDCLLRKATEDDRTALVVWMFSAMSKHPDLQGYTSLTEADRDRISKKAADTMQRLVLVDCRSQSVQAMKEGGDAFAGAFEALGRVAGAEIMSGPQVSKELERLVDFFDPKAMGELGAEAGMGGGWARPSKSKT